MAGASNSGRRPAVARYVNRSRFGGRRGYDVHNVQEAFLALPPREQRRRKATDDRRLEVAHTLHDDWLIDCDDLLACRPFVRLRSQWILTPSETASPNVSIGA
jgi:hypothetical protein